MEFQHAIVQLEIARLMGVLSIVPYGAWKGQYSSGIERHYALVRIIAGNNDGTEIAKRFGRRKILTIEAVRVGMVHGDGQGRSTKDRALAAFAPGEVDVVLFGHSHRPYVGTANGMLVANPGSPTDKRINPLYSYALLTVDGAAARIALKFYASRT